jgi:hypothetical protein
VPLPRSDTDSQHIGVDVHGLELGWKSGAWFEAWPATVQELWFALHSGNNLIEEKSPRANFRTAILSSRDLLYRRFYAEMPR